ncbi:MAG: hypothetical protein H8E21_14920 [Gammaproteobacteria bacterium]|nr:hypothetical protein [Gammaproteobacteria bacterium]
MKLVHLKMLCLPALGLLFAGCAATDSHNVSTTPDTEQIEYALKQQWEGEPALNLLSAYGKPDMIIDTTLQGGPVSEGYVYADNELIGSQECIDVFVVEMQTNIIYDYFCQ